MATWHVLTTSPQREFKAEQELRNSLGLLTLVPFEIRHRKSMGKGNKPIMTPYKVPLMPSYVFAGSYGDDPHDFPWPDVKGLRDVRSHVSFDGIPARLKDSQIDLIRTMAAVVKKDSHRGFAVGDKVSVIDGPFASFEGLIERLGIADVVITLDVFGRKTPATMSPAQVERLA